MDKKATNSLAGDDPFTHGVEKNTMSGACTELKRAEDNT